MVVDTQQDFAGPDLDCPRRSPRAPRPGRMASVWRTDQIECRSSQAPSRSTSFRSPSSVLVLLLGFEVPRRDLKLTSTVITFLAWNPVRPRGNENAVPMRLSIASSFSRYFCDPGLRLRVLVDGVEEDESALVGFLSSSSSRPRSSPLRQAESMRSATRSGFDMSVPIFAVFAVARGLQFRSGEQPDIIGESESR